MSRYIRKIHSGLLLTILAACSCTSLKETRFKDNPDFQLRADKLWISSKIPVNPSKPNTFEFGDSKTGEVREFEAAVWRYGETDIDDWYRDRMARYSFYESNATRIFIVNKTDDIFWEAHGIVPVQGFTKKTSDTSSETTTILNYPVVFRMIEGEDEIGKIVLNGPTLTHPNSQKIALFINEKQFEIEYQKRFNTSYFAFEYKKELMAFVELSLKGLNTKKGEALINPEISNDLRTELLTSFILAEIVSRLIEDST